MVTASAQVARLRRLVCRVGSPGGWSGRRCRGWDGRRMLQALVEGVFGEVTRHNVVRRTTFSERWLQGLIVRYMRQQHTSAERIAKLVEVAKEVVEYVRRGESSSRRWTGVSSPSTTPSPTTARRAQ
ncbi:type I restriction enzyme endonuclease domain-containing protein [Actinacidiphila alni]|uniref:type I restriction enzyme endonuclease domain-containing protein n=1 Tax=Actinacidiphila alni TaxID=380248 RepID=UPI003456031D